MLLLEATINLRAKSQSQMEHALIIAVMKGNLRVYAKVLSNYEISEFLFSLGMACIVSRYA